VGKAKLEASGLEVLKICNGFEWAGVSLTRVSCSILLSFSELVPDEILLGIFLNGPWSPLETAAKGLSSFFDVTVPFMSISDDDEIGCLDWVLGRVES
jgi:hypothetical protein